MGTGNKGGEKVRIKVPFCLKCNCDGSHHSHGSSQKSMPQNGHTNNSDDKNGSQINHKNQSK